MDCLLLHNQLFFLISFRATTLEHVPHPSEKDMELVYIDEEYQKEGGLVLILIS